MANITSEAKIGAFSAGVTLAVISTISLMSNILLLVIVGKRHKSRLQHSEKFLTLYGCLEGTYASVPAVLSTVSYLSHQWSVNANEVICDFHGWISFTTKCACVVVTTCLLLERYLEKSRSERDGRRIPKRLFCVSVCGVVASGLIAAVPVMTGHKMASYEPTGSYCHFDYRVTTSTSRAYSLSIVIIGYILLQAGLFCYVSICCERRRKSRDKTQLLGVHSEINGNILNYVKDNKTSQQRAKERGVHRCATRGDDVASFIATVLDEPTSFTATVLAVVAVQWLCYLPFLIVIVMAQTGYDISPELDFAVVRVLSIEGALNPLIVLWSFPPYRLIIQLLLCGRCSNGGEKKKQNEGLYEPEPKHVSQSVVYDSAFDDAPSWYLSRPHRSLPKSYSTGDLISHSLEDSTKVRPHRASVRSILIPSKSSEFLPSPSHRYLEKPRRSIHWEDDVMGHPGIKGDMSRVILVRQGADGRKAGGESICYVNEEDSSCSSEMSSQSSDWTTDSDEDPMPVYVINGKAYYIASLHQNDGDKRCALCDCKDDADQRMLAQQETDQRASISPEENGRVRGRAEQRAARCVHPTPEPANALDGKETLSVRPKSAKPRVLRKQAERLKRIKDARGEMREQREMKEVAVIADFDIPQVHSRNLEYSANMNSSENVEVFSRDTIDDESASNLPLEFYQHERNATNPVFMINDEQRHFYHDPEKHIAGCVGSRQHGAVVIVDQGYSLHDHPDLGAIKEDEDEVLVCGCRRHQGKVQTINQSFPLHGHPDLCPIKEDGSEVLGQGEAVQDRLSDLKKTPQKSLPHGVGNTAYNEVSPKMLHHNVDLIGAETGQDGSQATAELPHLGRGMDSLKHLEIHCEQLLQRSLSFRNDIDGEQRTKEGVTTTETSNLTDGEHAVGINLQGSQHVPSQTEPCTPILLKKTNGSHVVSNRITSEDLIPQDKHTLHQGAVANYWNSSRHVYTNETNCQTEVSIVQSNRRTIQDEKGTNGNLDKDFPSYINAPRDILRSNAYETSCRHDSKEDIQALHHLPAAGEAQIMTENRHRIFKKEPQDASVSANSVLINMTDGRYDVIDDSRAAKRSVSIGTLPVHHHQNQYKIDDERLEEPNTVNETPVAILVNSGSVSDIPSTRGDGTRNQQKANGLRNGETGVGRGFNKPRVSDPPLEKDIVFHGLTSEDPQVINLLFQKVIMRPEHPAREEPLSEAVARAADGEPVVGKVNEPKVTVKTRDSFQKKSNMHVAGETVSNQMPVHVRKYDHSYSEITTASSAVEQPGSDGDENSPSGDITYRHFLRAINLTPAKKQPGEEQTTVPSISVTPSVNDVNWASSESDDSMSSDGSVASLFCKPPMLKLGSKRRKGKHNLTIPYWLNSGSGGSHTNDDQSHGGQVGNVGMPSSNNNETMPNLPENKLSGIHYFECEESNDKYHQRKRMHGTCDKLPAKPKDVDLQLVPDSVNRNLTNVNTESTITGGNTRLGFQQTQQDFNETKGNDSGEMQLPNKPSKEDINESTFTETHTDQNLHSTAETTSSPSPSNPAPKRRRSHSLDTSGFLEFTPTPRSFNNRRNENVLATDTKVTNERARRTSLPQHMLSQGVRPFAKSEIL